MLETDYRSFRGGEEPMCTVEVDGVARDGYVRAWSARPEAQPAGWWAFVQYRDGEGYQHIDWFHADAVTEVPEP